jgi:hypothetical protein
MVSWHDVETASIGASSQPLLIHIAAPIRTHWADILSCLQKCHDFCADVAVWKTAREEGLESGAFSILEDLLSSSDELCHRSEILIQQSENITQCLLSLRPQLSELVRGHSGYFKTTSALFNSGTTSSLLFYLSNHQRQIKGAPKPSIKRPLFSELSRQPTDLQPSRLPTRALWIFATAYVCCMNSGWRRPKRVIFSWNLMRGSDRNTYNSSGTYGRSIRRKSNARRPLSLGHWMQLPLNQIYLLFSDASKDGGDRPSPKGLSPPRLHCSHVE